MSGEMEIARTGDPRPDIRHRAHASRPLFFVSYARTPSFDTVAWLDPDKLVEVFFDDLCEQVAAFRGGRIDGTVGFIDRGPADGDPDVGSARLWEALATCQVFVPLCSPRYFENEQCGREWSGFVARATSGSLAPIVRVLWAPVPLGSLPLVARHVRSSDADTGDPHVAEGLYSLMTVEGKHDDYRRIVTGIARQIVAASEMPYPAAGSPAELATSPNAFARPPRPRLRVIVLAPTTSRLPEGRAPTRYGPSALDWDPYRSSADRPISSDLRALAENLDFEPELAEFDDALDVLLEEERPTAPAVLIIDVWALQDPDWRAWLRRFDRLSRPWISVLVVLNPRDAETSRHAEHLARLLHDTLTRRNTGGRIASRLAARGAQTVEEFTRSFSAMAETAGVQYLMHSRGSRQREREAAHRGPDGHGGDMSDESEA